MSSFSNYANQSKLTKRLIWAGYILYLIYIWPLDGFDTIIEPLTSFSDHNAIIQLAVAFGLYWAIVFFIFWITDN